MGIWNTIKNRGKTIDKASGDSASDEKHEEGTPRQNKRQCIHIDPITKQPKHPEGHSDG